MSTESTTEQLETSINQLLLLIGDKTLWPLLSKGEQEVVKQVAEKHNKTHFLTSSRLSSEP